MLLYCWAILCDYYWMTTSRYNSTVAAAEKLDYISNYLPSFSSLSASGKRYSLGVNCH